MRQNTVPKMLVSFISHHMIYIVLFDASTMKGQIHLFEVRITVRSSHFGTDIGDLQPNTEILIGREMKAGRSKNVNNIRVSAISHSCHHLKNTD